MTPKNLPNLVSGLRLALAPALVAVALAGSRRWFVATLAASLMTDALDGVLARRLHAESDLGRRLDSAGDYATFLCGIAGIGMLWPELAHAEWPWAATGMGAFFAVMVYGLARLGRAPCYHTWMSKALAVTGALALVPLLAGWSPWPFRAVMALQVVAGIEELAIAALVPWHVGQMATVWHARRLRAQRDATAR